MNGQPFGYITFTLLAAVAGQVLAVAFLFAGSFLDEAPAWAAPATKVALALLLWLPVALKLLRTQALSLAEAGGLPATVRPARVAWLVAIGAIVLAIALDILSEGKWATKRHASGGYLVLFWIAFPLLVWAAVKAALGGAPIENKVAIPEPPKPKSPFLPRDPSGTPIAEGDERQHVLRMLALLDEVDGRFVAAFADEDAKWALVRSRLDLVQAFNTLWHDPIVEGLPEPLRWNIRVGCVGYGDALDYLEILPGPTGDASRAELMAKFRNLENDIPAKDDVQRLVELGRRARNAAAVDAGVAAR